jgi:MFS transporter, SP family, arabinose:H+ symporter
MPIGATIACPMAG